MAIYQGVNGVNREIKQIFQGIGGVNREIKERWEGVGGVNRQVFSGELSLYDYGKEVTAVTGGWIQTYLDEPQNSVAFVKNLSNMYVAMSGYYKRGSIQTLNKIKLRSKRFLKCEYAFIGNGVGTSFSIGIRSTPYTTRTDERDADIKQQMIKNVTQSGILTLDVSDITTDNYIAICVGTSTAGGNASLSAYKIWLE